MEVNVEALIKLLEVEFNNNQTEMAKAFGVSRYQLNTVLRKNGKGAGAFICGAIIKWCENHGRYYKNYIFLN